MTSQEKALKKMKLIFDAINSGKITIVYGRYCFDPVNHVYSVDVIYGVLSNLVHEGLGLEIPDLSKMPLAIKRTA